MNCNESSSLHQVCHQIHGPVNISISVLLHWPNSKRTLPGKVTALQMASLPLVVNYNRNGSFDSPL